MGLYMKKNGVLVPLNASINIGIQPLDNTVTFMNGDTVYQVCSVKTGCGVYAPTINPTSTGKTFVRWSLNSSAVVFPYIPTTDVVIDAVFSSD